MGEADVFDVSSFYYIIVAITLSNKWRQERTMPKVLKLYLDTSIPNGYFDPKNLNRQRITKEFWLKLSKYQVFISDIVIDEIKATGDKNRRQDLLKLVKTFECLSVKNSEIKALAKEYIVRGVIPVKYFEDALHIAVATVNSLDILIS